MAFKLIIKTDSIKDILVHAQEAQAQYLFTLFVWEFLVLQIQHEYSIKSIKTYRVSLFSPWQCLCQISASFTTLLCKF
jgi:hypothetical protein